MDGSRPLRRSPGRRWHHLVEHYTPDGAFGRLLFAAVSGSAAATAFPLAVF